MCVASRHELFRGARYSWAIHRHARRVIGRLQEKFLKRLTTLQFSICATARRNTFGGDSNENRRQVREIMSVHIRDACVDTADFVMSTSAKQSQIAEREGRGPERNDYLVSRCAHVGLEGDGRAP